MPSPNQNSREMLAWLKQANEAHFMVDGDYGYFGKDDSQGNMTNADVNDAADLDADEG